ncbi:MAG: long-chain acyl-CoA synthetase [Candidatus Omnitrophota bacterium]|jgi:long-chain acyl-CoA synthetase
MSLNDNATSLVDLFESNAAEFEKKLALRIDRDGSVQSWTWYAVWQEINYTAQLFCNIGLQPQCKVGIWAANSPEWCFSDVASMLLGAVSVPIYTTLAPEEIVYILNHSQSRLLVVDDIEKLEKIDSVLHQCEQVWAIVLLRGDYKIKNPQAKQKVYKWNERPNQFADKFKSINRGGDSAATIIYTSGTTGRAKGVVLTHANFLHNVQEVCKGLPIHTSDKHLSFLPLCHVFERMCGYYLMAYVGADISYASSIETVIDDAKKYEPTFLLAVPRFYEKVFNGIKLKIGAAPNWKKALFAWSLNIGGQIADCKLGNKPVSISLKVKHFIAHVLIFKKIRALFGGHLRFGVSGGAPLDADIGDFFKSIGLLILEGYGLTETSPVIAMNRINAYRFGTVGLPLEGVDVKIGVNDEILTKSESVMQGYYHNDDATKLAIEDGWFHTGDQGRIDEDGFLVITGRIKEIIVLSGGKKMCPVRIEVLMEKSDCITKCVLYGDGKNFLTALILPDFDYFLKLYGINSADDKSRQDILSNKETRTIIQNAIDEIHKDIAPFEQIKYFEFIERDFTIEDGELTPTLKLKRNVVADKYGSLLDQHYE